MSRHRRRLPRPRPDKDRITFSSEHNPHWRRDLASSTMFMALASPAWLCTPRLWEHVDYARQLGLPFRIALLPGTVLPEGLFAGVVDLEIQPCDSPEEVEEYILAVLQQGRGGKGPP